MYFPVCPSEADLWSPLVLERVDEAAEYIARDRPEAARRWVREEPARMVIMHTGFGDTRMIDMLVGDPLPRIC